MNIQEQEHWDHEAGRATDFQNAFSEAHVKLGELQEVHGKRIERALALGLSVVTREVEHFCRSTDAFVGVVSLFVVALPSEAAAEARAAKLSSCDEQFAVVTPARRVL